MIERRHDVANVFWLRGEILLCLHCREPVSWSHRGTDRFYHVWWSTNEDRGVYFDMVGEEALPRFTRYKFCSESCCRAWAKPETRHDRHIELAAKANAHVVNIPPGHLRIGSLVPRMPMEWAEAVINIALGRHYTVRRRDRGHSLSNTSDERYPGNSLSLIFCESEGDMPLLTGAWLTTNIVQTLIGGSQESLSTDLTRELLGGKPGRLMEEVRVVEPEVDSFGRQVHWKATRLVDLEGYEILIMHDHDSLGIAPSGTCWNDEEWHAPSLVDFSIQDDIQDI